MGLDVGGSLDAVTSTGGVEMIGDRGSHVIVAEVPVLLGIEGSSMLGM